MYKMNNEGYRGAQRIDNRWDNEIAMDKKWLNIARSEYTKRKYLADRQRWLDDRATEAAKNQPH